MCALLLLRVEGRQKALAALTIRVVCDCAASGGAIRYRAAAANTCVNFA